MQALATSAKLMLRLSRRRWRNLGGSARALFAHANNRRRIARTQNVGAKNNAPFHFRPETFLASTAIKIQHVSWIFRSISITNAVEASEVCRGFGRSQNVIDRDCVFSSRQ